MFWYNKVWLGLQTSSCHLKIKRELGPRERSQSLSGNRRIMYPMSLAGRERELNGEWRQYCLAFWGYLWRRQRRREEKWRKAPCVKPFNTPKHSSPQHLQSSSEQGWFTKESFLPGNKEQVLCFWPAISGLAQTQLCWFGLLVRDLLARVRYTRTKHEGADVHVANVESE